MRFARTRPIAVLAGLSFTLAACSADSADLEDLEETLVDIAGLTPEQAACVAEAIEASGAYTEDQIKDLGDGESEEEGLVTQFDNDVVAAVNDCS